MKIIIISFIALTFSLGASVGGEPVSDYGYLKTVTPSLSYSSLHPEPSIKGLVLPGKVFWSGGNVVGSEDAIITNLLPLKEIANAVERRYGLPTGIMLAIVAVRSGGVNVMPERTDTGAVGVCYLSAAQATAFHLRTYQVCTVSKNRDCAAELRELLATENRDYSKIFGIDQRLHPIIAMDAVARAFLVLMGNCKVGDPFRFAAQGVVGKNNIARLQSWQRKLADPEKLAHAEATFNKLNEGKLTVDGFPGDFQKYLQALRRQNENYGLAAYLKLPAIARGTVASASQ